MVFVAEIAVLWLTQYMFQRQILFYNIENTD